ncbi:MULTISPECIES: hypothetical protein [Streptomyces]|uniref:hypothetical protein n=1 Tax=Streptomyces TaxID=1883 RepID=UPI002ED28DD8|nr:hypothetical protein OG832_06340 [Streptomyces sp. NBC_00826]WTH94305.1 hypothetical protein OIC43_37350 [Streptomyces sp. NBC_00825]WTI03040.1 hypothetical protein OHA23_37330 [Streptomyces sp. NBC_00822]
MVTDHEGRATWTFGATLAAPPVISAVPFAQENGPLTVTVEEVTRTFVTVRVWRTRPVLRLGLLPAMPAARVDVHLTATLLASTTDDEAVEG